MKARGDLLVSLETEAHLERKGYRGQGERMDPRDLRVALVRWDPRELQDTRDQLALWDFLDSEVSLVLREPREAGEMKDFPDLLDQTAGLEREASRALLGPQVPLVRPAVLETRDRLDLWESRARPV